MGEDLFSKSFDHLLAFVLPGMVFLWGYSYVDPTGLGAWFREAAKAESSVGGFLFLSLAPLGLVVFVSGVRAILFESWLSLFPKPAPFRRLEADAGGSPRGLRRRAA